ncbi:uncharacterized protein N7482_005146 [Penicillium canariense]|uniref:Uncharacterized protein n=1 Tax=Penicillium canariense TaxID=189055 RepID=A0A9W9I1V1_9EURO|nr:uncharacterized protein N7482_005146 [Penicillium canariense]KAJ5166365.1 hypothetical protein N7482_005146 [Penicillium canariense]
MDGDRDQRMKRHERLMARSGNAAGRGRATDRFDQAMHPRGDPTGMSQAPDRAPMSYDYGYTGSPFHGALQPSEVQAYGAEFARPRQAHPLSHQSHAQAHLSQQSPNPPDSVPHTQRRAAEAPPFVPYESAMLYGFSQQGPAQGPFDVVPQYPTRQSAAIETLSNQFPVSQYFASEESTGTGVPGLSPYMNTQLPYTQPGSMARSSTTQPFPTTMADFTPLGTGSSARLDALPVQQQADPSAQPVADPSSLDEAYAQYQRALRSTFDQTRAGRLVEASQSLLEISEWLVTNARDLGILRDDHQLYTDRLQLWSEFNLCWLAVCQKQKDVTQDLVATGQQPPQTSLLSRDRMEAMGKDLIQLCDQLEQHGLVDYQMGIWEEEILSVLGQCLDLMESRPELLRIQPVPEAGTAAQRP